MSQPSKAMRVLVVDDEAPARKRLSDLLSKESGVDTILEAHDGLSAVRLIQEQRPDVVFLDVQMPGLDGLGVIAALGAANMPPTVFVTGYDRFAVQAFEADALDYLLKPFGDGRYRQTMERVERRLADVQAGRTRDANAFGPELLRLASQRLRPGEIWKWISVRTRENTRLVIADDIDWIEAAGVYVTLHVGDDEYLYRAGLAEVTSRLDPFQFVRIHRSCTINLRSVASLERRSHGEFHVVLKTGRRLTLSRSYRAHVESILGQSL